ncbi:unnamed protein product [Cuscuta europaea]|uniref:Uncharacterized protein n=1 Tax=Cuscuta europaea TaxID=41803 RepID=A0A9P1EBW5_CUSEU|nr:unnamed protein product [Cuscuta europaea]
MVFLLSFESTTLADLSGWIGHARVEFPSSNTHSKKLGVQYPFSELVSGFLALPQVSPCQVMPQTWRLLRSLEVLIEKNGLKFTSRDLVLTYDLRTSGKSRFILTLKTGRNPLILGISNANDRGWMEKFFFVERASLGEHGNGLMDSLRISGMYFVSQS